MSKNKYILASIILYILAIFVYLYLAFFVSKTHTTFFYFLIAIVILYIGTIIYGLLKQKRWVSRIPLLSLAIAFVSLINSLFLKKPINYLNLLLVIPAIPLIFVVGKKLK